MKTLILTIAILAITACSSTSNLEHASNACEKGSIKAYYERDGSKSLEFACRKYDYERRIIGGDL